MSVQYTWKNRLTQTWFISFIDRIQVHTGVYRSVYSFPSEVHVHACCILYLHTHPSSPRADPIIPLWIRFKTRPDIISPFENILKPKRISKLKQSKYTYVKETYIFLFAAALSAAPWGCVTSFWHVGDAMAIPSSRCYVNSQLHSVMTLVNWNKHTELMMQYENRFPRQWTPLTGNCNHFLSIECSK